MKKIVLKLIAITAAFSMLAACGSPAPASQTESDPSAGSEAVDGAGSSSRLKIVATTFPQYDWLRQILGDELQNVDLVLLMDDGVDLHSYQPTAEDIATISDCDMLVHVGGISDTWVDGALESAANPNIQVVNLLQLLGDRVAQEEIVEGMQDAHDHDHEDEHVWISVRNAQIISSVLGNMLGMLDGEYAEYYAKNAQAYTEKLAALDNKFETIVTQAPIQTIVFADRFPFRYLADDYGLSYYAAFSGCSAETEASFETIAFLSGKVSEYQLKNIFVIDGSDQSIAKTVVENTTDRDQEILVMDSMQSVTAADVDAGATYISIMEKNLEALEHALAA